MFLYPLVRVSYPRQSIETSESNSVCSLAGPRNCIGQKFAMYEMKSVLSKMLLKYEFSVDPSYTGPILVAELILKPQNGVIVNIKRRQ